GHGRQYFGVGDLPAPQDPRDDERPEVPGYHDPEGAGVVFHLPPAARLLPGVGCAPVTLTPDGCDGVPRRLGEERIARGLVDRPPRDAPVGIREAGTGRVEREKPPHVVAVAPLPQHVRNDVAATGARP